MTKNRLLIPPPVQMLSTGFAIWLVARTFPQWQIMLPYQREVGTLLIGIGILIEVASIVEFIRARTTINPIDPDKTRALVTNGLYRISRNPMYLGMVVLLTGWAIRLGNPLNVILIAAFVFLITVLQIKPEERILRDKFGPAYDAYCKKVRRWI